MSRSLSSLVYFGSACAGLQKKGVEPGFVLHVLLASVLGKGSQALTVHVDKGAVGILGSQSSRGKVESWC